MLLKGVDKHHSLRLPRTHVSLRFMEKIKFHALLLRVFSQFVTSLILFMAPTKADVDFLI